MENIMLPIYQDFITENLTVRFTIPVFSVIFKNSAAITNTRPDTCPPPPCRCQRALAGHEQLSEIPPMTRLVVSILDRVRMDTTFH